MRQGHVPLAKHTNNTQNSKVPTQTSAFSSPPLLRHWGLVSLSRSGITALRHSRIFTIPSTFPFSKTVTAHHTLEALQGVKVTFITTYGLALFFSSSFGSLLSYFDDLRAMKVTDF